MSNPMAAPESWTFHAHQRDIAGEPGFDPVADERTVQAHGLGLPIIEVTVTEDPEGPYQGWIHTGADRPRMIQHHRLFAMQFPYGWEQEVELGKGRAPRLRIEAQEAQPRTWQLSAAVEQRDGQARFPAVGPRPYVQMFMLDHLPILDVLVTEDPEGEYCGWVDAGQTGINMIEHHRIFSIQFANGVDAEIEAGNGHPVRVRIDIVK